MEEEKANDEDVDKVTLKSILNNLYKEQGFVEALIGNLQTYCQMIQAKIVTD